MSLVPRPLTPQNYLRGWAGFGGVTFTTFYKNSLIYSVVGTVAAVFIVFQRYLVEGISTTGMKG
jgi:multiple sugar transport system permease protein